MKRMMLWVVAIALMVPTHSAWAQVTDPGVRGGAAGGGAFVSNLYNYMKQIEPSLTSQFGMQFVVTGGPANGNGLGPRFNSNSCGSCHAQPAPGGSSPASNPLFSVYQLDGATNTMPSFELTNGPVLVPRFPFMLSNLSLPDGQIHQLFTITGRSDAGTCSIAQPDFTTAQSDNDLVFRQPLPMYGDGYVEIVDSQTIINNENANQSQKRQLGISGHPNLAGDTSVGRFGWKAQWRALLPIAGIEEVTEMGVTNEIKPTENDYTAGCVLNPVPEDASNFSAAGVVSDPSSFIEAADRDAIFARFLTVPVPSRTCPGGGNCANGKSQFTAVGCVLCHTTSLAEPPGSVPQIGATTQFAKGINNIALYSDLLVHDMGPCLADNITQGSATGDQFRTPPLWNVGQRIWFMHDGRTSNIVTAVEDHFCTGNSQYPNSEANATVTNFNNLSVTNQQDLIDFLRSL